VSSLNTVSCNIRIYLLCQIAQESEPTNSRFFCSALSLCEDVQTALFNNQSFSLDFFSQWRNSPPWARASSLSRLHDHRHTTLGRTPLDEWSARRRDLYLTTHKHCTRQTSMPPAGFEHTIPVSARPQTYAVDRVATGIGFTPDLLIWKHVSKWCSPDVFVVKFLNGIVRLLITL
jgi:hypothetical protein